jgi:hypothetical protein
MPHKLPLKAAAGLNHRLLRRPGTLGTPQGAA